jgi:hypothetical protein
LTTGRSPSSLINRPSTICSPIVLSGSAVMARSRRRRVTPPGRPSAQPADQRATRSSGARERAAEGEVARPAAGHARPVAADSDHRAMRRVNLSVRNSVVGGGAGPAQPRPTGNVALVRQRRDPLPGGERVEERQDMTPGCGQVVDAAGLDRGDPLRPAGRAGQDLQVPAVVGVLAGPPQVHPGRRAVRVDLRRLDEGAVEADERPLLALGACQDVGQGGRVGGDDVDRLVQVTRAPGSA